MSKISSFLLCVCLSLTFFYPAQAAAAQDARSSRIFDFDEARQVIALLEQPEAEIDLARAKLTIDRMVDPTINIDAALRSIDDMVVTIQSMAGPNPSSQAKVRAIRNYLYKKGQWNNGKSYQYDFDDPLGTKIANKMLPNYMTSKKGNCITMPFLFIILGDRLGINVTASTAPLHVLVKYTDDATGHTYNLETTSGANPARDSWYRQQMPMTDQAIANGIYLQPLTRKETVAVMVTVLAEHYVKQQEFKKAIAISDITLRYYPKYVNAMLRIGSSYYRLLDRHFIKKYPKAEQIPVSQRDMFTYLSNGNRYWFAKAEALGWREPGRDYEAKYLQQVKKNAKTAR